MRCNFIFYILIFTLLAGCRGGKFYQDTQVMMGTFVEVTSIDKDSAGIVFKEIKRIEDLLSKYKAESEVSKLNKLGKLVVSPETFYIIEKSKEFWELSDGAFDITVAPLVDLWGFSDKKYRLPKDEELKEVLKLVGTDKIILQRENNMVEFIISGMKIDLGGVAKGYAVDCAVKKLREQGIKSCLINAGGQVYALGDKSGKPWKIAIKDPRKQGVRDSLELKNKAVSTSGDYEQYFYKAGKRYSHILNPKTGYPVESDLASVTVISESGLTADYLSTAIFVLGKEKGRALAKKFPDTEVRIIEDRDGSQLKAKVGTGTVLLWTALEENRP